MKTLLNIREVLAGVFDADYYPLGLGEDGQPIGEPMPYTLAPEDIESADMSNASMLSEADKQAEVAKAAQDAINNESLAYLKSTDWYIVRLQETGKAVPQTILDERQAARDRVTG
jgi:hypothetical protein